MFRLSPPLFTRPPDKFLTTAEQISVRLSDGQEFVINQLPFSVYEKLKMARQNDQQQEILHSHAKLMRTYTHLMGSAGTAQRSLDELAEWYWPLLSALDANGGRQRIVDCRAAKLL